MDEQVAKEEPTREPSRVGGALVLTVAALGLGVAFYNISRDTFVVLVWVLGAGLLWRAARKMPDASNPSPPPPEGESAGQKPQVSVVRDKSHPNRWVVTQPSRWLDWTDDE